jgi:hypothetical protein
VKEGDRALIQRNTGKPSNRKTGEEKRERYGDFGPTLAVEKLAEVEGVRISGDTLRRWLTAAILHLTLFMDFRGQVRAFFPHLVLNGVLLG